MTFAFALSLFVCAFALYSLGFLALSVLGLPRHWAFISAPAMTLCILSLLGEAFYSLGIPANPLTVLLVPLAILLALFAVTTIRRRAASNETLPELDRNLIVLYAGIGILFGLWHFAHQLPALDAVFEKMDMIKHGAQIQAFVDAERFTSLHSTYYLTAADNAINPMPGTSFYPSAWHIVCALVVQLVRCNVPLSMNAVNCVFAALVYPLSLLGLMSTLFKERSVIIAGALTAVCVTAFPWGYLVFGPLFPNLAGFACIPIVASLFIGLTGPEASLRERLVLAASFVVTSIGMVLAHPNALFSTAVLLIPYCASWVREYVSERSASHKVRNGRIAALAFLLVSAVLWVVVAYSPAFIKVTSHNWPSWTSPKQALINCLTMAYTYGFRTNTVSQPFMAIAVAAGFLAIAKERRISWVAGAYALAFITVVTCSCSEGFLKHALGGYWYTDPVRLAATAGIIASLLSAVGFHKLALAVAPYYNRWRRKVNFKLSKQVVLPSLYAIFGILAIFPSLFIPGLCDIQTAFSGLHLDVKTEYAHELPYSPAEREFVNHVKEIVPEDALIINMPSDGSILSYGLDDLRCYYRYRTGYDEGYETKESIIVREHLNEIATNDEVAEAVSKIGAGYVMVLDATAEAEHTYMYLHYEPAKFEGILSIDYNTPGFMLVYASDNCHLYKITG